MRYSYCSCTAIRTQLQLLKALVSSDILSNLADVVPLPYLPWVDYEREMAIVLGGECSEGRHSPVLVGPALAGRLLAAHQKLEVVYNDVPGAHQSDALMQHLPGKRKKFRKKIQFRPF